MADFGETLRSLRKSKNLTQKQVSEMVGVTKSTISAYEANVKMPSYDVLLKISSAFKVSTDFLLGNKQSENSYSLEWLTESQTEIILKLIAEFKKMNWEN
ncbi:MAG: helix-turn-helix transcriptional regulator [Clostridia bacterium]|nr:helix-turn-helix transcriptional regulator [Clostridia bacterium]